MTRRILPRRSQRRTVSMAAQCRTQSGLRGDGEISDISAEGCCLQIRGIYFKVATRLIVRPCGMEGLPACVRWIKGDLAGVEFDRPLYGPVLEYIAAAHAAPPRG